MLLWDGVCHVHAQFSLEKILDLKREHPQALILHIQSVRLTYWKFQIMWVLPLPS